VEDLGSNGDVGFIGDVIWLAGNGRVQVYTEQMLNQRVSGGSGTLRIRLWATATPYDGEAVLEGYPMATRESDACPRAVRCHCSRVRRIFRPPPTGEYYVTMTLEESVPGGWNIVDYVTFRI
jgi:hypothetical protein